jgi:hypothetical protein
MNVVHELLRKVLARILPPPNRITPTLSSDLGTTTITTITAITTIITTTSLGTTRTPPTLQTLPVPVAVLLRINHP